MACMGSEMHSLEESCQRARNTRNTRGTGSWSHVSSRTASHTAEVERKSTYLSNLDKHILTVRQS